MKRNGKYSKEEKQDSRGEEESTGVLGGDKDQARQRDEAAKILPINN